MADPLLPIGLHLFSILRSSKASRNVPIQENLMQLKSVAAAKKQILVAVQPICGSSSIFFQLL